ncbi:class I poly(R)-hydroxyalkanoic acid synthase [Paraburkholderia sp.]|uniref:class I poly(R)-hydroxyalkanoic acid synthase n=1 Tax=Paraburkholderia sp. TaxID=1926495 RepID=UPI003C7C7E99
MITPPRDPNAWFAEMLRAQQAFLRAFDITGSAFPSAQGCASTATPLLAAARTMALWSEQTLVWWEHFRQPVDKPDASDRRFLAEAWHADPRYAALVNNYTASANLLRGSVDCAPVDPQTRAKWHFALRQVLDALSPANCFATNPEALQLAVETGGASLVEGVRLFLQDLAKGRVSMTDDEAFEVGRNVATAPGGAVFENELMQLIQYSPGTPKVYERPLLIVPPCINKFYILDLQPENSLVAHAVAQGHTVFLVSWRNVSAVQGHLGWDDYLEQGVIAAIDTARAISGADRVNTLGFCVGGTLLACALAVLAARGEHKTSSLTLLTTMLDFDDTGEIGLLVNEAMVAMRESAIGHGGLLQGRELAHVFASLRANDLIWPYVINGYLKGKAPPAFDLLFWNCDDTNLPGPMFCWYLRNTYLENRLCVPGATVQCGEAVDFGRIDVPAFIYASRDDHIVPWRTAYASTRLLGGETRFVLGASGHIAGVINPPMKNRRNHWVGTLDSEPQRWLDVAQSVPGSWWTDWADWLAGHAGGEVNAPKKAGNRKYPVIEPAPGRYVKEKAA